MNNLTYLETLRNILIASICIILSISSCTKSKQTPPLTQLEVAKYYIYQNSFQLYEQEKEFEKCLIKDSFKYPIHLKKKKLKNDTISLKLYLIDSLGESRQIMESCNYIGNIDFVGNSKIIRKTISVNGIGRLTPLYDLYIKDKNFWIYSFMRKSFLEDTLRKDSLYFQKVDTNFIKKVNENKNIANPELLKIIEKLNGKKYIW